MASSSVDVPGAVVLLLMLAFATWTASPGLTRLGGGEGVVTGALSIHAAFAFLFMDVFGREVLPVRKPIARPLGG
jgi:succinate-acetate transporter protein